MNQGFFRVAACVPSVAPGQCQANAASIVSLYTQAAAQGALLVVTPEMSVTGYTCADLFHNQALISASLSALESICAEAKGDAALVVGMPLLMDGVMHNCAVFISDGAPVAVVPKTYIPNYNEFYEKRWWHSAPAARTAIKLLGREVPFGTDIIVEIAGVKVAAEICEDLWVPIPPSCRAAMAGAEVVVNLSASDDTIGKYAYLRELIAQQSARCLCGYVYASAGYGESSTDLVFDGKAIIAECGKTLAANPRWQSQPQTVMADIDLLAIRRDRLHNGSWADCRAREVQAQGYAVVSIDRELNTHLPLMREVDPHPFVPSDDADMHRRCDEIINIQVAALAKRLDAIHCRALVVGISGGLDSTLALLVAHRAFQRLGLDPKGIIGITMPGFGTTGRTLRNAMRLMEELGVTIREIPIGDAVKQHFKDIGHDIDNHDVTYENSQARERTQILMDAANQAGGIVLGTGDLSELALGWATYNGDHMSMYGVNAGVPKTLVRYLVRFFALEAKSEALRDTLLDIIDTPISPELTPADAQGNIQQVTEDIVGPYELHDFFLYYTLRYGFSPERIAFLARQAFNGVYDDETIDRWLATFVRRFFQQQFKRSCLPDGPKVGSVCLSPRGDWRMPSDMTPIQ